MWGDNSIDSGSSATDVLRQICGGWNPSTVTALRKVLAERCGLTPPTRTESNLEFLRRLAKEKIILLYEIDENEWL